MANVTRTGWASSTGLKDYAKRVMNGFNRTLSTPGMMSRPQENIGWSIRLSAGMLKAIDLPLCLAKPEGTLLADIRRGLLGIEYVSDKQLIEMEDLYGAHNYHPLPVVLERGEGVWVYDVEGRKYLDCLSGYSALNLGHSHPRIVVALIDQAREIALTSRAFRNPQLPRLARELCQLTGYEMMLPMNSGAEAVETAVKIARKWAYQVKGITRGEAEIITCENNFHGRTVTIVSFSTEPLYKDDFAPFTPGFKTVPFDDLEELKRAITPRTAAFLVEPIQAEAGIIIPSDGYLKKAQELCRQHNVLFIADEIQTGLGRTGKLLACEHESVRPDVMVIGKSLGGGVFPISAVLSDRKILGLFKPGEHGSTFGGNPLACAVARESLKVLVEEGMIDNAVGLGAYFIQKLKTLQSPYLKEVRGRGLLIGVELLPNQDGTGRAREYCEALMKAGLLCKETHDNVIRFAPPLIITREDIDWAFARIAQVFAEKAKVA